MQSRPRITRARERHEGHADRAAPIRLWRGKNCVPDLSCNRNADELVLVVFEKKFTSPCKGKGGSLEMLISGNVR